MTVQELINSAMRATGELRHGQQPNPEESATALGVLNALLSEMSTQHRAVYIIDQKQFQLQSGKACYTMGPSASADFNTERPVKIQSRRRHLRRPVAGIEKEPEARRLQGIRAAYGKGHDGLATHSFVQRQRLPADQNMPVACAGITFERTHDLCLVKPACTRCQASGRGSATITPRSRGRSSSTMTRASCTCCAGSKSLVGLFTFLPQNTVCWEVHIILLPRRKTRGHVILRGALDWMFENTTAQRIVGAVPQYNRLAVQVAQRAGMKIFGVNPNSFMKNGKLENQVLFGLSKEVEKLPVNHNFGDRRDSSCERSPPCRRVPTEGPKAGGTNSPGHSQRGQHRHPHQLRSNT